MANVTNVRKKKMLKKTRLTSAFINDFVIECLWWCLCYFAFSFGSVFSLALTLSLAFGSAHLHSFGNSEPVIYNVFLFMEVLLLMNSPLHRYDTSVTTQCNKPNKESIHFHCGRREFILLSYPTTISIWEIFSLFQIRT